METVTRTGPFWDIIDGRSPLSPSSTLLGWELLALDAEKGSIHVRHTASPEFWSILGTLKGGTITAMLDDAMGAVATAYVGGHRMTPTIELKTSFIRPAGVGALFVEANVVHRGNNIMFL